MKKTLMFYLRNLFYVALICVFSLSAEAKNVFSNMFSVAKQNVNNDFIDSKTDITSSNDYVFDWADSKSDEASPDVEMVKAGTTCTISASSTYICVGGSVTISRTTSNVGTSGVSNGTAQYNINGGTWQPLSKNTTVNSTYYPTSNTTYGVRVLGYSGNTECGPHYVTVNVVADPVAPTITRSPNTSPVCEGTSLDINISGGSGGCGTVRNEYRYYNGSWSSWSTSAPAFSAVYGATNSYQARRYASGSGCGSSGYSSTNTVSWAVDDAPTAPTGITVTGGGNSICPGDLRTLIISGGNNGTSCSYQWYSGSTCCSGGVLGTGSSLSNISPGATTNYFVRRVGTSTCTNTTSSASVTITVNTESTAPSSISTEINP